jgi:HSP20 family protein
MFDPMRTLGEFSKRMNELADNVDKGFSFEAGGFTPRVDIVEKEDSFLIYGEFPGMKKEDIKINVNEDKVLKISGNKNKTDEEGRSYLRTERMYGEFERRFVLSDDIDLDGISAKYENGVLELATKKKEPVKPKEINVEIG